MSDNFKELLQKEELVIKKINLNRVYFTLGDFKFLIYEGIDDEYDSYTCVYQVDYVRRRVVEPVGFCYHHINPTSLLEFKGNRRWGRGMTYSNITNTDKLKAKLLSIAV